MESSKKETRPCSSFEAKCPFFQTDGTCAHTKCVNSVLRKMSADEMWKMYIIQMRRDQLEIMKALNISRQK